MLLDTLNQGVAKVELGGDGNAVTSDKVVNAVEAASGSTLPRTAAGGVVGESHSGAMEKLAS